MQIGIKIAKARQEKGITQTELADKMSVTRQTVSRWETGAAVPDIEKVASLAKILQVSCDYLLMDNISENDGISLPDSNPSSQNEDSITKLLAGIEGKYVRISFYEDEEDVDASDKICKIDSFEGNWIKVSIQHKNEQQKKLIALSSILSFEIVDKEDN